MDDQIKALNPERLKFGHGQMSSEISVASGSLNSG